MMSRLIGVYLCLLGISQQLPGIYPTGCNQPVVWQQASKCCGERSVISLMTEDDLAKVTKEMKQGNFTTVWTGLQRKILPEWTWTDNNTSSIISMKGAASTARCALLDMKLRTIEPETCAARGKGHICEKKGCHSCSDLGVSTCRKIKESCFIYHCDEYNFDIARAACVKAGQDLAKLPKNFSLLLVDQQHCDQFWIGLRREDWLPYRRNGDTSSRSVSLWSRSRAEPLEEGICSIMAWDGVLFTWRVATCTDKHRVVCGKRAVIQELTSVSTISFRWTEAGSPVFDKTTKAPVKSLSGNIGMAIGVSIGLFSAGTLFGLLMLFIVRRRFRRRRHLQPKRTPSPTEAENQEGISLVGKGTVTSSKKLRGIVGQSLLRTHRKFELWSFLDDVVEMHIDDIYTEMTWKTSEELLHTDNEQDKYTGIFAQKKDGLRPKRILVYGEAGVGKTSFVKKILVDWSKGVRSKKIPFGQRSDWGLSRLFTFMIPIFLRDIHKGDTLVSIIKKELKLEDDTAQDLFTQIQRQQSKTLLILDGYDEFMENTCSDIPALLDEEKLPDVNILITCRSPYSFYLPREKGNADMYVELKGFSDKCVKLYVDRYSKKKGMSADMKTQLFEKIDSSDDLQDMSKIPALLLLMCILWNDNRTLSKTATGFYVDFAKYMCMRYARKYIPDAEIDNKNVLEKFENELKKLGKLAFDGLRGEHITLIFSGEVVDAVIGKDDKITRRLGFIRLIDTTCDNKSYSFHHKTVQEFFTAFYIVHCDKNERLKLLMSLCSSEHRRGESKDILRFVTGLGGYGIKYHVEEALTGWTEVAIRDKVTFMLTYLDENRDVEFELPSIVEIEMSSHHKASTYKRFFNMTASDLEELHMYVVDLSVMCYLRELNAPPLGEISISFSQELLPLYPQKELRENVEIDKLLLIFPLRQLAFKNFAKESAGEIVELCKNLDSVETLKSLDLSTCEFPSESAQKLRNALPRLEEKEGLHFGDH